MATKRTQDFILEMVVKYNYLIIFLFVIIIVVNHYTSPQTFKRTITSNNIDKTIIFLLNYEYIITGLCNTNTPIFILLVQNEVQKKRTNKFEGG